MSSEKDQAGSEDDPLKDLKYLKGRINEEREKRERELRGLGQDEARIDNVIQGVELLGGSGIPADTEWRTEIGNITGLWRANFDNDFPPDDDPTERLRTNEMYASTAGSITYSALIENAAFFEAPEERTGLEDAIYEFESLQESAGKRDEVIRRLGWISEDAANKFQAAWAALEAGIPSADPASGAALGMRSALDVAIRTGLLKRTPEPHPIHKAEYLPHIAEHAARGPEAGELLNQRAREYVQVTDRLSKVKGTTEIEQDVLRGLFYRAQELLFLVTDAIDVEKLLPK